MLLLLLLLPPSCSSFLVTVGLEGEERRNGSTLQLSHTSTSFTLWCEGGEEWDVCKWYRPGFAPPSPSSPDCCSCYSSTSPSCSCPTTSLSPWAVGREGRRCRLTLGPLDTRDSGWWRCALSPVNSNNGSTFTQVAVARRDMVQPVVVFDPGEVEVEEGQETRLNCTVERLESGGRPRVGWGVGGGGE